MYYMNDCLLMTLSQSRLLPFVFMDAIMVTINIKRVDTNAVYYGDLGYCEILLYSCMSFISYSLLTSQHNYKRYQRSTNHG